MTFLWMWSIWDIQSIAVWNTIAGIAEKMRTYATVLSIQPENLLIRKIFKGRITKNEM